MAIPIDQLDYLQDQAELPGTIPADAIMGWEVTPYNSGDPDGGGHLRFAKAARLLQSANNLSELTDAAAARTALELGDAALAAAADFATAAQGALADSAVQPADLGDLASENWPASDGNEYVAKNGAWTLKTGSALSVQEADGTPTVSNVDTIVVSNGTLTDDGGGQVTITTGGGGASLPVADTTAIVKGSVDDTKLLRFEIDGFTTGTTRVLTPPDQDGTIALLERAQTFTAAQTVQVATASNDAIRAKTTDSSATNALIRCLNSSDGSLFYVLGDGRFVRSKALTIPAQLETDLQTPGFVVLDSASVAGMVFQNQLSSGYTEMNLVNNTGTGTSRFYMGIGGTGAGAGVTNSGYIITHSSLDAMIFRTYKATAPIIFGIGGAGTEQMRLNLTGLGIGATPSARLHVDQSSTTAAIPVLLLDQADVDQPFTKLIGTSDSGSAVRSLVSASDFTTPGSIVAWEMVIIEDTRVGGLGTQTVYRPLYGAPTA